MSRRPIDVLRRVSPFDALEPAALVALDSAFVVESWPPGCAVVEAGERGGAVFLVLSGALSVEGAAGAALNRLGEGALFGLVSLVDDAPRSATCRADGECVVARLPKSAAAMLFHRHEAIALAFQRALATQLAADFRHLDAALRRRW
jgi:CRP/FNR family cyclic AMP-dependent transcriptional regulator